MEGNPPGVGIVAKYPSPDPGPLLARNAGIARQASACPNLPAARNPKDCIGEASACSQVLQDSLRPTDATPVAALGRRTHQASNRSSNPESWIVSTPGARSAQETAIPHPPRHAAFFEVFPGPWYRESRPSTDENVPDLLPAIHRATLVWMGE